MSDQRVISADGILAAFNGAGVLGPAELQVAQTIARLVGIGEPEVVLAVALAVRQLTRGSACVDLALIEHQVRAELTDPSLDVDQAHPEVAELPWPQAEGWIATVAASDAIGDATSASNALPARLHGTLLYLERWWLFESRAAERLTTRLSTDPPRIDEAALTAQLDALFDGDGLAPGEPDLQRRATEVAARNWTSVIAGGPGTGKTTTVAKLLQVLRRIDARPGSIALAAPSGKAASRLEQSVRDEAARLGLDLGPLPRGTTLHRLLGYHGAGQGFTRNAGNPLAQDVVVLDEVSMVDLPLFAQLLEALRPQTRLVMVGDPHQLSSVDAGKVLADLAEAGLRPGTVGDGPDAIVELLHNWRNTGGIAAVADQIRTGDADGVLATLAAGGEDLQWIDQSGTGLYVPQDMRDLVLSQGTTLHTAALVGDAEGALAALDQHRILCAHREGRFGVSVWSRWTLDLLRGALPGFGQGGEWYPGRPILATSNNREIDVSNGDTGVIVDTDAGPRLALPSSGSPRLLSPSLVDGLTSLYAMTVHKSQGSQFTEVTVVLPPPESPLLTRELLYTAVTRARSRLRILGSQESIRAAVERGTQRASGLAQRLRG